MTLPLHFERKVGVSVKMPVGLCCFLADSEGSIKISDFGIAISEEVLAAEHADARSTIGQHNPSGGFHKRHMVSTRQYTSTLDTPTHSSQGSLHKLAESSGYLRGGGA